ncbi:MAG: hypothetical protein ACKVRP_03310 [Bacteroidota bacterium]
MLEKLIERWLDEANERVFQIPFCFALTKQGYTVVHLSRHTAMELGKDILAIDPTGTPCAFQLKGTTNGRLSLSKYRDDVQPQLNDLVFGSIVHPSINPNVPHRSFLVVNGILEEEVQRSIDDFNRARAREVPNRQLETIVRGELFEMFKNVAMEFWPTDAFNLKTFLELHIDKGDGQLPKDKFCQLIESSLPLVQQEGETPSHREATLQFLGAAIITALSLRTFTQKENHVAEVEGWTLLCSYILLGAEKWNLPPNCWKPAIDVALLRVYSLLGELLAEVTAKTHLVSGSPMSDFPVHRIRVTHLVGLMSIYGLWRRQLDEADKKEDALVKQFCNKYSSKLVLWGEYALPQFLAYHLYQRIVDATIKPELFLYSIIDGIIKNNVDRRKGNLGLPNPYYAAEDILPFLYELTPKRLNDSFVGSSYGLEAFVHLFIRTNQKNRMKSLWPDFTKLSISEVRPEKKWDFYLWRLKQGENTTTLVTPRQNWTDLWNLALESSGSGIPELIKDFPILYLLLIMGMPHRLNSSGVRWIATKLKP